jgi:hypothetical protein
LISGANVVRSGGRRNGSDLLFQVMEGKQIPQEAVAERPFSLVPCPTLGMPRLQAGRDAAIDIQRMPVDEG